jgi:hypothetical protein
MTYLSVIAAAAAAALVAASAQADVATGQATGKRIDKPMTAATGTTAASGSTGLRSRPSRRI